MEQNLLDFAQNYFNTRHIQTLRFDGNIPHDKRFDLGLREMLFGKAYHDETFKTILNCCPAKNLIYIQDRYQCYYTLLRLNETSSFLTGPYLLHANDMTEIAQMCKKFDIPREHQNTFQQYMLYLPVISPAERLDLFIYQLARQIIPEELLSMEYLKLSERDDFYRKPEDENIQDFFNTIEDIEKRYALMKLILDAVRMGNSQKALHILTQFLSVSANRRFDNPVKDKSYWLSVFNTTLRNVAWEEQVHPYYLDKISSAFSFNIITITENTDKEGLMRSMIRQYCRLIQDKNQIQYSAIVQRVILTIDYNLNTDLSLHTLAEQMKTNPCYLSALFKKEVGIPLTEYVNRQRVEKAALYLEKSGVQIQVVGQMVGIYDLSYFCRLFKRYMGVSPSDYRKQKLENK